MTQTDISINTIGLHCLQTLLRVGPVISSAQDQKTSCRNPVMFKQAASGKSEFWHAMTQFLEQGTNQPRVTNDPPDLPNPKSRLFPRFPRIFHGSRFSTLIRVGLADPASIWGTSTGCGTTPNGCKGGNRYEKGGNPKFVLKGH